MNAEAGKPPLGFQETNLRSTRLRDLHLEIEGTRLEPIVREFEQELDRAGIQRLRPRFYLATEWGVPFNTIAIGIPFYLAHPDLLAVHAEQVGHIEGFDRADILRYLRHEMGHVVNYGYKLYEDQDWINRFGSITQPYLEQYRPEPFSTRFVLHLPGWYAQKHPDEDWSETFAVWMTPAADWRAHYTGWPEALAKLKYCDAKMAELRQRDPLVTDTTADDDIRDLATSIDEYYASISPATIELPPGLDGSLRAMFEDMGEPEQSDPSVRRIAASALIERLERQLMATVYRWTGHFPEETRTLLRYLARRADELQQVYPESRELEAATALTTLVTSLAATHVHRGSYLA
jgi:hypothetical protein